MVTKIKFMKKIYYSFTILKNFVIPPEYNLAIYIPEDKFDKLI